MYRYLLDTAISDVLLGVSFGVRESDGDGTVPLLSLGYMYAVTTRKYSFRVAVDARLQVCGGLEEIIVRLCVEILQRG